MSELRHPHPLLDLDTYINDRLLSARECASRLGVSTRTLQSMWTSGEIPSVYVGRLRRTRVKDLAKYISELPTVAEVATKRAGRHVRKDARP